MLRNVSRRYVAYCFEHRMEHLTLLSSFYSFLYNNLDPLKIKANIFLKHLTHSVFNETEEI
jgi:hypothetical protein